MSDIKRPGEGGMYDYSRSSGNDDDYDFRPRTSSSRRERSSESGVKVPPSSRSESRRYEDRGSSGSSSRSSSSRSTSSRGTSSGSRSSSSRSTSSGSSSRSSSRSSASGSGSSSRSSSRGSSYSGSSSSRSSSSRRPSDSSRSSSRSSSSSSRSNYRSGSDYPERRRSTEVRSRSGERRPSREREYDSSRRTSGNNRGGSGNGFMGTGISGFVVFMVAYVVIALIAIFITFGAFKGYLKDYDKSLPETVATSVANELATDKASEIFNKDTVVTNNRFTSLDNYISSILAKLSSGDILVKESKKSTKETPLFTIYVNNAPVTDMSLKSEGKNKHDLETWNYDKFYPDAYNISGDSFTISAPTGSTVTVNGIALGDADIAKDENGNAIVTDIEVLKNVKDYISSVPTFTTYQASGIDGDPEIKVVDKDGNELALTQNGKDYVASMSMDQSKIDEQKPYVEEVIKAHGEHFLDISSSIYNYIMPNSELYENIQGTVTNFYSTSKIANYTFDNVTVDNFIQYTDNCYSCDIYYDLNVTFNTAGYEPQNEGSNMTWVFVEKDGKWYLTDTLIKGTVKE